MVGQQIEGGDELYARNLNDRVAVIKTHDAHAGGKQKGRSSRLLKEISAGSFLVVRDSYDNFIK